MKLRYSPLALLLAGAFLAQAAVTGTDPKPHYAARLREQLVQQVLPYWCDTAVDKEHGGYVLADDVKGRGTARDKQLVSQARMVWGFSHAHIKQLGDGKHDYLAAARQGYRFLLEKFRDLEHGGYYWKTDLAGKPVVDCKFLYGESFVIYAFVEFHRATGEIEPLRHAMDLFQVIQERCRDKEHGGWIEHTESDWRPLAPGDPRNEVEVVGYRSANAHLHWMEALAELYDATRDPRVGKALEEALHINQTWFYPQRAGLSCFHRQSDWSAVTDPKSAGLSYGHNVEFAWLMIRAEEVLGREPSWKHFDAHLRHALSYGYDTERGGLYSKGEGDQPATDTQKVWWVQSEMLAALTDALCHRPDAQYDDALNSLLRFLTLYQILPADGIWLESVSAEGRPSSTAKAHNWKANYHDVRALVKFIEAFDRPAAKRP